MLSRCKSCGKEIKFIKTKAGKYMPVDPESVQFSIEAPVRGADTVVLCDGSVIRCKILRAGEMPDGNGYIPHWATCNRPDDFRKR